MAGGAHVRMIRPGARITEKIEMRVSLDQPAYLGAHRGQRQPKRNFADSLVANISPRPSVSAHCEHSQQRKRQATHVESLRLLPQTESITPELQCEDS